MAGYVLKEGLKDFFEQYKFVGHLEGPFGRHLDDSLSQSKDYTPGELEISRWSEERGKFIGGLLRKLNNGESRITSLQGGVIFSQGNPTEVRAFIFPESYSASSKSTRKVPFVVPFNGVLIPDREDKSITLKGSYDWPVSAIEFPFSFEARPKNDVLETGWMDRALETDFARL